MHVGSCVDHSRESSAHFSMCSAAPQPESKKSDGSTHGGSSFASFAASDMSRAQRLAQRIADDRVEAEAEAEVDALFGKVLEYVVWDDVEESECGLAPGVSAIIDEAITRNKIPLAKIRI